MVNHRTEDVAERVVRFKEGRGVDRIAELDFAADLETRLKVIELNGAIAAYASTSNRSPVEAGTKLGTVVLLCRPAGAAN